MSSTDNEQSIYVSVIVAIYNVEQYLEQCLQSLVNQTQTELEIIAVDDGSTDGSAAILDEFAEKYPGRIKAIHKTNGGLSDARNTGIEYSSGDYLGFVDGDDWVRDDMYEQLYGEAVSSQSDIVVCAHNKFYDENDGNGRPRIRKRPVRGTYLDFNQRVIDNPRLLYASRSYAWNKLYRKNLFIEGGHRFPVGMWFEDSATIYNVMLDANKIACVFDGLYNYRIRAAGAITSSVTPKIFDIFSSCDAILNYYYENTSIDKSLYAALEDVIQSHITRRFDLFEEKTHWRGKVVGLKYVGRAFAYLNSHFPRWAENKKIKKRKRVKPLTYMYVLYPYVLKLMRSNANEKNREIQRDHIHEHTRSALQLYGYEVVREVDSVLQTEADLHFADFDTLLGFIREGELQSRTLEIHFGVFADESNRSKIAVCMRDSGYVLQGGYSYDNKVCEQTYFTVREGGSLKVRLHYYESQPESCCTYLFYTDPYIAYEDKDTKSVVKMTYSPINQTSSIVVKGIAVPVPENADSLLDEKYGEQWRTSAEAEEFLNLPSATRIQKIALFENG